MGVKSTVTLTYAEAIDKYVKLRQEEMVQSLQREAFSLGAMNVLADVLEDMNDRLSGGEGFENYRISDGAGIS